MGCSRMGNAILKKFEDIKETMNCCSTNKPVLWIEVT